MISFGLAFSFDISAVSLQKSAQHAAHLLDVRRFAGHVC
jgi:hypothetical protein